MYLTSLTAERNHMVISVDVEKSFDKIWNPFMKNTFSNLKIEKNCLNLRKDIVPVVNALPLGSRFTLQYLLCDGLDSDALFLYNKYMELC